MRIINDLEKKIEIATLEKWFELCPPEKGEEQWKDLHSAKEMAKFWLNKNNTNDFLNFIRKVIPNFTYEYIIPELASPFDNFRSPRKHDLCITEKNTRAIVTIEGKANESFGTGEFGNCLIEAIKTKYENINSNAFDRMINLYLNFFHSNGSILPIMYQLLYWFAGSILDAIGEDTENIIMVLQEFTSSNTDSKKQIKNHEDFCRFIEFITERKFNDIKNGQIIGPITNKYTSDEKTHVKKLYIGYYSVDLME